MFARPSENCCALRRGEILSNVIEYLVNFDELDANGNPELKRQLHPFSVVLTQDCDLEQDFKERVKANDEGREFSPYSSRCLPSILIGHAVEATELKFGKLDGREHIGTKEWDLIKKNNNLRYHFIAEIPQSHDLANKSVPELVIDFKRYSALPTELLYQQLESGSCFRRSVLCSPYAEHLAQRFTAHLARVALPEEYSSI